MSINIGGSENDLFYRYKRDKITILKENKNGGQTKLVNIDDICKQLNVSVKDLTKYIQKNLAVSNIKNSIIQAQVDVDRIETIINKFVAEFVLCKNCRLPELQENVCKSCGSKQNKK